MNNTTNNNIKMTIFYRDEIGIVAQICEHIIFNAGFNGNQVMVMIDDDDVIKIDPENIIEIMPVDEDDIGNVLFDLNENDEW